MVGVSIKPPQLLNRSVNTSTAGLNPENGAQWVRKPGTVLACLDVVISIRANSAAKGATASSSARNFSRLACYKAVVGS